MPFNMNFNKPTFLLVYIISAFYVNAQSWQLNQSIHSQDLEQGDKFGQTLVMHGDFAAVSALGDNIGNIDNTGSVYIFKKQSD